MRIIRPHGAPFPRDDSEIKAKSYSTIRAYCYVEITRRTARSISSLCGARKYERTEGRKDTRAGSYDRQLHTKAGEVTLTVPKLRSLPFETAIIERYRRRESSVEEALIEMYADALTDNS